MEATVSSINSLRGDREVTTAGWAAGEAGSSLCPLGGLPAAWEDSADTQGKSCLPDCELLECCAFIAWAWYSRATR